LTLLQTPQLPQGFLSPADFHSRQWEAFHSNARVTCVPAGQGGGKTSLGYWWLYRNMCAYPGESHLLGFPDFGLLNRVVTNQPDPDRPTLVQFLSLMGEDPLLHIQARWIECRAGTKSRIFFASGTDLVGWEGAHVKSAWIDEFDECPVGAYRRAMERTSMRRGFVLLTGTPRNVRWVKKEVLGHPRSGDPAFLKMVNFTSVANPKYSQEAMDEARLRMQDWEFRRMHMGELADMLGGNLFKREWWQRYTEVPSNIEDTVQFWDTAFKAGTANDYSVCATWAKTNDGKLYILDVLRLRLEWPDLLRTALSHASIYRPSTIRIEDKASGQSLIQELRSKQLPVIAVGVDQDKWRRASSGTGLVEAGYVYIPEYADWVGDFIEEHAQFTPDNSHDYDDQVDTTSMALAYFKPRIQSGGISSIQTERRASNWDSRGHKQSNEKQTKQGLHLSGSNRIVGESKPSSWR
jgi:predicted phage terminase large subunit-like protein